MDKLKRDKEFPKSEEVLKQFGSRIRTLRKERQLSQRELALATLMEKSTIQRIERGLMNCTIKTLIKLAHALNVEFKSLFDFPKDDLEQ